MSWSSIRQISDSWVEISLNYHYHNKNSISLGLDDLVDFHLRNFPLSLRHIASEKLHLSTTVNR